VILDTNALSAFADGVPHAVAAVEAANDAAIPVIVLGEFRYGVTHSKRRREYEAWLDRYLLGFRVLAITMETTSQYAVIRTELRLLGKPIPANDVWIAALCQEHRLPLLSRDRYFDRVPGLRRLEW
jgi:predicted nucleic acid-binding protein